MSSPITFPFLKYCGIIPLTLPLKHAHTAGSLALSTGAKQTSVVEKAEEEEKRLTTLWAIDVTQEPSSERKQKLKGTISLQNANANISNKQVNNGYMASALVMPMTYTIPSR